jgi:putative endonuclease
MPRQYYVYILTNDRKSVLYAGITNDLKKRVYQHKEKMVEGFTKRYNTTKLVYYEVFEDSYNAIAREKQIKAGSRANKMALIHQLNKQWVDLYDKL